MTARMLFTSLLVFTACTGSEPPPETEGGADPSEAAAMEERDTGSELEPGSESVAARGQAQPERAGGKPRGSEGTEPAASGARPDPGATAGAQLPSGGQPPQQDGAAPAGQPQAGADTAEGVIAVTGTAIDSRPVLQKADGALGLTGELSAELRRLSGARIRVEGERRAGRLPGESIEVSNYTVLEVNGQRPEVGTITVRDGIPWLAGHDTVRLIGASDRLASVASAKVWVTGRRTAHGFEVSSYGVIRH